MATSKSQRFQDLGNGFYRVTGVRVDPMTGLYITKASESRKTPRPVAKSSDTKSTTSDKK